MSGITVTCYGVCEGDSKYRDPETGWCCSLCGGSGKVTSYNQRETAAKEWDDFKAKELVKAEKAAKKMCSGRAA